MESEFERGFKTGIDVAASHLDMIARNHFSSLPEEQWQVIVRMQKLMVEQCAASVRNIRKYSSADSLRSRMGRYSLPSD